MLHRLTEGVLSGFPPWTQQNILLTSVATLCKKWRSREADKAAQKVKVLATQARLSPSELEPSGGVHLWSQYFYGDVRGVDRIAYKFMGQLVWSTAHSRDKGDLASIRQKERITT